jgi:ABC-type amino acid transport substrate-binding protein
MFLLIAGLALLWLGCDLPRDPEGTFTRVEGGTMRVGISENPPWVLIQNGEPSGIEVQLMRKFAQLLEAGIEWRLDSETRLMNALQMGKLDVVVGGLKESTPWSSHVGMTRPYVMMGGEAHVMVVRQGENRWLLALDKFLHGYKTEISRLLEGQGGP